MALRAFLQVGLSFADVGLFEDENLKAHQRFYLPKEPLGNSLKKFWEEHQEPSEIFVSSRFLEKILDAKLGGTVAQLVTAGFETWPVLRQPVHPERFDLNYYRQDPLASQELIFGVSERVDPDGKILKAVELSELDFINSKLKLMGVKRVCVNFLFANKNPSHQNQVARFFEEQGFEVFAAPRSENSSDEMPAWRKNVINACLSGAFTEHLDEIKKSFSNSEALVKFLDHQGHWFTSDKNQIAGSLFAWTHALSENLRDQADQILYLGLESWFMISNHERTPHWQSPWGRIESSIPKVLKLKLQPTLEVRSGFWGGIHFSKNELGFEPGPIAFGRAHKPTVFDFLNEKHKAQIAQIQPQASQKFRDQLNALVKNIPELGTTNVDRLLNQMTDHMVTLMSIECQTKENAKGKTIITGIFAPFLYKELKKRWVGQSLILDSKAETRDIESIRSLGAKA